MIALWTALVGATVSVTGLTLAFVEFREDHQRRKKQATIEAWMAHQPERRELRKALSAMLGDAQLDEAAATQLYADVLKRQTIDHWLGLLEYVALGVNTDVFDYEVLRRASGTYLVRSWLFAENYVLRRQEDNPRAFVEFEEIAKRIWFEWETLAPSQRPTVVGLPHWLVGEGPTV